MIKLSSLYKASVIIFTIVMLGVPLLFPFEILGTFIQRLIIVVGSLILFVPILLNRKIILRKEFRFLNKYMFLYLLAIVVMLIFSQEVYAYSWERLLKEVLLEYLLPLTAFLIVFIFYEDNSIENFLSLVSKIVLLMLAIRMFSWSMYNFKGQIYFPRLLFQYEGWIRDGFQRIESGMLYGITLVYVTVQSLSDRSKNIVYKVFLALMLLFLLWVTRVRFQLFISVLTVGVIYLFYKVKSRGMFVFKITLLVSLLFILFINTELFDSFLENISTQGQYGASALVRIQGVQHYLSIMYQKNAYFGLGFLLRGNAIADALMSRNQWNIYYLDDLGILGTFIQIGLFTIITHVLLFIKAIQVTLKSLKVIDRRYSLYSLGFAIYLILSCLGLNIFDRQRIFDVPFYLAIYSFLDARISEVYSNTIEIKREPKEGYGNKI